jgi:hypothetical protein
MGVDKMKTLDLLIPRILAAMIPLFGLFNPEVFRADHSKCGVEALVRLREPLKPGKKRSLSVVCWYNITAEPDR